MKTACTFVVALCLSVLDTIAQSTSFTYQGELSDQAAPASGIYDLHFTLFDEPNNGAAVAGTITNLAVSIADGTFTLLLDFGVAPFGGEPRWLEIGVRTNNAPAFTILQPRQEITRVPYAISALEVTGENIARLAVPNTSFPASGEAVVTSGFITGANLTSGGFGYVVAPNVTVQDSTGSGAQIAATIEDSRVTALTVVNAGTGYSGAATLVIEPPPRNEFQVFATTNVFAGVSLMTNINNTVAGTFNGTFSGAYAGSGAGLSNVNAATLEGVPLSGFWRTEGNAGSSRANFFGTTDNQSLELRANNRRLVLYEPTANGSPNLVGGSEGNYIAPDVFGTVIAGGGTINFNGSEFTNSVASSLATISGGGGNTIIGESTFSTISGGALNEITGAIHARIGGGQGNRIQTSASGATIGGGEQNLIEPGSLRTTIGGGRGNTIDDNAIAGTISGGSGGKIHPGAQYATIGGGIGNTILTNGTYGTVPGGFQNYAGIAAFAAGTRARAIHDGSFVWADSGNTELTSTGPNQFLIRATGGVGIGTNDPATMLHVHSTDQTVAIVSGSRTTGTFFGVQNTSAGGTRWSIVSTGSGNGEGAGRLLFFTHASNDTKMRLEPNGNLIIDGSLTQSSDRDRKKEILPIDSSDVLERVIALPISSWKYNDDDTEARHLGPMAQDFHAAFGLGNSEKTISAIDADGVALAAIQGLNRKLLAQESELERLRAIVGRLERAIAESSPGVAP